MSLTRLHPADRADAFSDLKDQEQLTLLPELDIEQAADILEELEDDEAADVAESLSTAYLADLLDAMEPDEAADVLGDLSPEMAANAIAEMEGAEVVIPLLSYPDETAGGLMTTALLSIPPHKTAHEAIEIIRSETPGSDIPYYIYVVDEDKKLMGVVGLRDLIVAQPESVVKDFMDSDVRYATTEMDQEDVARMMVRYDLAALPVVSDDGVLWGVITHDDTMEVLEEEATEDIYRLANVSDADLSIDSSIGLSVKRRLPWLFLSALTALFASWVITRFESVIAQVALLAAFLSVVAGLGGNTATQSLAIIVRAIALGEIEFRHAWKTVLKESAIGLIDGIAVGLVVGIGVYLWTDNYIIGIVLCLALIVNMFVAAFVGTLVPLFLKAIGQDPALASSVVVTAITDSVGFAVFLGMAAYALTVWG